MQTIKVRLNLQILKERGWIFSNDVSHLNDGELDPSRTSFVKIEGSDRFGVYDKTNLISIRLFPASFSSKDTADFETHLKSFLSERMRQLKTTKQELLADKKESYRLCHSDGDGVPGVIVDSYGDVYVVQSGSKCGDKLLPYVVQALGEISPESSIYEKSTGQSRQMEGLEERTCWRKGTVQSEVIQAKFCHLALEFNLARSQKTGLFLDQRYNLSILKSLVSQKSSKSILDICSYMGAWSSVAVANGASLATLIDQDKIALEFAKSNVTRNQVSPSEVKILEGDMFEHLAQLGKESKRFDVVVADPPAFAKSKKHLPNAKIAYGRLTKQASKLVNADGIFVACSCSRNMDELEFYEIVKKNLVGDNWVLLGRGMQSLDHTITTLNVSSEYLKCFFFHRRAF